MKLFGVDIWPTRPEKKEERGVVVGSSLLYTPTPFGVGVDGNSSLAVPAFQAAVRIIADSLAATPVHLSEIDDNGNTIRLRKHYLTQLLNAPSPLYTGYAFRRAVQMLALLHGNAYAVIVRDEAARPSALIIVPPSSVDVFLIPDSKGGTLWYEVKELFGQRNQRVPADDIIHITGFSTNGITGTPVWKLAGDVFELALAAQKYEANFFKNGAIIQGYLSSPRALTEEQAQRIAQRWSARYAGVDNANATPVLEGGLEYKTVGSRPQDAMVKDTKRLTVEDVSRLTGVPTYKLSSPEKATFDNVERQARDFYTHTLLPHVAMWEQELTRKLVRTRDQGRYQFRFDFSEQLRADADSTARMVQTLFDRGVLSINEARKLAGLNTIPDAEWASAHYIQLNMQRIDRQQNQNENE